MGVSDVNTALSALSASEPSTMSNAVSMKMLSKTLDMSETMNDSMIKMMELSVNPNVGSNFDMSV